MNHFNDCGEDFANVTRAHRQKETVLNYGVIASLGTCALVTAQFFMSSHALLNAVIALGMATIVDANVDRIKNRRHIQKVETSFVGAHGTSYEKLWIRDLNEQEKAGRKKNLMVSTLTLSSIASALIVAINVVPEFRTVMMPAFIVGGLWLHAKTTKKASTNVDEIVKNRRTLVEQIHHRRSVDEPTVPAPSPNV